MLKQVIALAAVCCCLATVIEGRRHHHQAIAHHKLDGFVAIQNNGTEVRAARGAIIAMKVTGGQGQASTRTSNGRIIVEINYSNGTRIESCKFIHGKFKLRHFYRKFLNHAPFSPAVHKALDEVHNHGHNSTAHVEVVKAVMDQGAKVLKSHQKWTGALVKEYGPMTNHLRAVHECHLWRQEHMPALHNATFVSRPDDDEADDDEEDFEDENDDDEDGDIIDMSSKYIPSYNISVVDRRNATFVSERRNASVLENMYYITSSHYARRNATGYERRFNLTEIGRRNSTGFDKRNMTEIDRKVTPSTRRNITGVVTRNLTVIDRRNVAPVERKNVVNTWNANATVGERNRNSTNNERVRYTYVESRHTSATDRRFGEVAGRWNATGVDKNGRKNITIKMNSGRSKRHNVRRGPQHPQSQQHHGFIAVQGPDASLPGTSEVRAARHGKLAMQTRVTTRDHNDVIVTETTNGQTIVKTITRGGEEDVEDCDIVRGPIKMRKFYRKFLDDAPLGPAVVRATAGKRHHGHHVGPNGTHPHPHPHPHHRRHHNNKVVVNKVTNRAWQSLNDSAHSWNDTLVDEYGQMTSFGKQMRKCRQWRKEHGKPHHLTDLTTDASFSSQSETENSDHVTGGGRVKRQLYAGTKWCGAGSSTLDEKDMGHHREVDKCCQKHDECPYNIEAFTTKWGLFNHRLTTISLCECDFRFRTCLRNVGTETADSVGYIFFEVVSPTCFNFRYEDVCVERTWYGKCTRTERQPKAVTRESLSFN